MVGAHAGSRGPGGGPTKTLVYERDHLVDDVAVVCLMASGTVGGVARLVRPALPVDPIDCDQSHPAGLDEPATGIDHAPTFEVPKATVLRRECENGPAVVAVNAEGHVLSQRRTRPRPLVDLHRRAPDPSRGAVETASISPAAWRSGSSSRPRRM